MLKQIFYHPTPKQFFYLILGYIVASTVLSYLLISGMFSVMAIIGSLAMVFYAYSLTKVEKVRQNRSIFLTLFLAVIFYALLSGNILSRKNFVLQKSQLSQTSGVIPQSSTYVTGKRRSSSSREFLSINNLEFHCQEDRMNSCDDIYRFHGKTATIYYQSGSSVGNLAYEIVVGNQTIYQFDKQLKSFQNTRKKQNHHLIWAFILFGLPSLYFYYLSKGVLSQVQVLTKEEEQELNQKANDYKLPTPSGKRIFTIILVISLMFFGLAINLQNQAFIILMILILGFILICSSIGWLIKKLMNVFKK